MPTSDPFGTYNKELTAPATMGVSVTPDDDNDLTTICRALWIGGAGDVSVILKDDDSAVTLESVPAGTMLSIRAKRVRATGTTASAIVALS